MAAAVHTGPIGTVKRGQNCQIRQKFLLRVGGGRRLVGCGQISLASTSKANGLNEAIPSQVWYTLLCWTSWYYWRMSKNWLVHLQRPNRVLHIGWSYGVGPKVEMRLFWIAYVCTLFWLSLVQTSKECLRFVFWVWQCFCTYKPEYHLVLRAF